MTMRSDVRRVGLLGGTFDPIHIGHLRSALEVAEQLTLDELRLIPSARPPHRQAPQVSAADRLAMVALARRTALILCCRCAPSWRPTISCC